MGIAAADNWCLHGDVAIISKNTLAILLILATLTVPSEAHADHTEGALIQLFTLIGSSSLAGVGGIVATAGTAVTYGESSAKGWRTASYIFGAHNLLMGAIWIALDSTEPFTYGVATAHLALGVTTIGLAIGSSLSINKEAATLPAVTVISDSDGQGVPVWGAVGHF